ncbi:MAG: hypothetical protein ACLFOY_14115 [Desulfatibacillaceae bacterium]
MFFVNRILLIGLCIMLLPALANAADYRDWKPLVPENIDGLEKSGSLDGANMDSGGQSWSTLRQRYSGDGEREIVLTIINGTNAPRVREFQAMPDFQVETEQRVARSLEVAGYDAFVEIDKRDGEGTLVLGVNPDTLVVVEAEPVADRDRMTSIAGDVPLDTIASQVK